MKTEIIRFIEQLARDPKRSISIGIAALCLVVSPIARAGQYICEPKEIDLLRRVFVETNAEEKTLTIEYMDSSKISAPAEYGDDVDMEYYISKKLDTQVEWYWSEMNENSKAEGNLIRRFHGKHPSLSTPVECIQVK